MRARLYVVMTTLTSGMTQYYTGPGNICPICPIGPILDPPATAVELCALFDYERRRHDISFDVRGAAEHEFFARENVALHRSVDLRDSNLNHRLRDFRTCAHDQRSVRRSDIPREMPVDSQHRFELHLAGEIHDVTHKT